MSSNNSAELRSARLPGWVTGLLVLQSLTLLVAVGRGSSAPEAFAVQGRGIGQPADDERQNPLPNAADQRLQQIRLLGQIKDELVRSNQKLEQIHTAMKDQRPQQDAGQ